ncbi:MAG TPA: hypothetical protein VKH35_15855 [Thermoanaerobaculia bacterium]|nr:hypothetical protein [Thermoanaerobaculia bacterium]
MRSLFLTISVLAAVSAFAGVKVAGMEFVPKDLIFAAAEPKSQATAEGTLPDNCKWTFSSETRVGKREEPGGRSTCIRYYYKTTVVLQETCPAPNDKVTTVTHSSERITADGPFCPDNSGRIAPPKTEAHVVSSGTTAAGKQQDIVVQPDGTRITLQSDARGITVTVAYTDGTADTLALPVK